ncbi:hypothetical protein Tco_1073561 [Tanacetum coccineum]
MSSPNYPTSNIEDAYSSNFPNYLSASPDYFPASPGKTYSSFSNSFGVIPLASPTLLLFHDDPYMKVMQAYYTEKSPISPPTIIPQSSNLNPRYIGPFKILEWISLVAYKLKLPEELRNVHNTFHIFNLKKCLSDESLVILMKELRLDNKLNFVEELVEIMDREVKQLKQSRISIVKVRWNSKRGPEFTWEREDQIRAKYPHLFSNITLTSN